MGSYLPVFQENKSGPISKGLPLENGTDKLSRNVGNFQSMMRNIPEERISDMCPLALDSEVGKDKRKGKENVCGCKKNYFGWMALQ